MAPLARGAVIFDPQSEKVGHQGSRVMGPLPVFHRLFEDLGLGPFLRKAETGMPLDVAAFAMVASRLVSSIS